MVRPLCFQYFDMILDVADYIKREGRLIAYQYPPHLKDAGFLDQKHREDVLRSGIVRMMKVCYQSAISMSDHRN